MKKVFKFATGLPIPKGAIYLSSVVQDTRRLHNDNDRTESGVNWFVWHYFLVEVEE